MNTSLTEDHWPLSSQILSPDSPEPDGEFFYFWQVTYIVMIFTWTGTFEIVIHYWAINTRKELSRYQELRSPPFPLQFSNYKDQWLKYLSLSLVLD